MEMENVKVSATVTIISRDRKALILQRLPDGAFPNLWTVAGGKIQDTDGYEIHEGFRYYSVEAGAIREVMEETGIELDERQLKYLCSVTTIWGETRRIILSFYVYLRKNAADIKIKPAECQQYKWIIGFILLGIGILIGGYLCQKKK